MMPLRTGRRRQLGMTLLEVIVALTILVVIVGVLITSLRVGVRAWETGERRVAAQQELRALVELLSNALSTAAPYRGRLGDGLDRVVLFQGDTDEVRFVTTAPPLFLDAPAVPFHAVTLRRTDKDELRLVERLVPADEPFGDSPHTVLARAVTAFKVQYRDGQGLWTDRWDPTSAGTLQTSTPLGLPGAGGTGLPTAVRIELTLYDPGRAERAATFVVPIALGGPPL
jgi:prepilin-type N-terminal cleavage/methylation domain-containing protein